MFPAPFFFLIKIKTLKEVGVKELKNKSKFKAPHKHVFINGQLLIILHFYDFTIFIVYCLQPLIVLV